MNSMVQAFENCAEGSMPRINKAGIYPEITEEEYHADPCVEISASRSLIKTIVERTPKHAFTQHPRLYTKKTKDKEDKFDLGTAAHSMILGKGKGVVKAPEEWEAWTTKASKEWREETRKSGGVPMLQSQYERALDMAGEVKEQLPNFGLQNLFNPEFGKPEVTAVSNDKTGGFCRIMIDWLEKDLTVTDLKTTDIELNKENIGRHCASMGYEFQHAFYERVMLSLFPEMEGRFKFQFLFVETKPPYAIMPITLPAEAIAKGRFYVNRGLEIWAKCKRENRWPAFEGTVQTAEYPAWSVANFINESGY